MFLLKRIIIGAGYFASHSTQQSRQLQYLISCLEGCDFYELLSDWKVRAPWDVHPGLEQVWQATYCDRISTVLQLEEVNDPWEKWQNWCYKMLNKVGYMFIWCKQGNNKKENSTTGSFLSWVDDIADIIISSLCVHSASVHSSVHI